MIKLINEKLSQHIKELEKNKLPENWLWHQDKITHLKDVAESLLKDLEELHATFSNVPEVFSDVLPLLQQLHSELERIGKKRPDIYAQAKDAALINGLVAKVLGAETKGGKTLQLIAWGLDAKAFPNILSFAVQHWKDMVEIKNAAGDSIHLVTANSLPAIKDLLKEENWPKIKTVIIAIAHRDMSLFRKERVFRMMVERALAKRGW